MSVVARAEAAALAALGIVYGDLGTSPLYTLPAITQTIVGRFTPEAAIGVLSLILWALVITVSPGGVADNRFGNPAFPTALSWLTRPRRNSRRARRLFERAVRHLPGDGDADADWEAPWSSRWQNGRLITPDPSSN
jgi:hypothetical protein